MTPAAECSRCKEPIELDEHTILVTLSRGGPKPTDQVITLCARCVAALAEFCSDPDAVDAIQRGLERELPEGGTVADVVAAKLIERAIGGDVDAIRIILDRVEGPVGDPRP